MNTHVSAGRPLAVVTGGSRGLGHVLVHDLTANGWQVITDARDGNALESAAADVPHVRTVTGDIADPEHQQALVGAVGADPLGLLVLNAGILGPSPQPAVQDYPVDMLRRVFDVNVIAQVGVIQHLIGRMQPGGTIIGITSDAANQPYENWGGYGASKAALEQILHILGAEHPDLRVYRVDPGDMRTRMHAQAFPDEDISDRPSPLAAVPGLRHIIASNLPSGRYDVHAFADTAENVAS